MTNPTEDIQENLNILKEEFPTVETIVDAIENGFDFEQYQITNGFKRHFFNKAEKYEYGTPGFYGDVPIDTTMPTTLCFTALTFIWNAMDLGYDRYSAIMGVQSIFKNVENEEEAIKQIGDAAIKIEQAVTETGC
jgi:hypothetical protein